ncbi:MAG: DoxX family protein, partial [Candidatus Corynebacterium faecigallinarum]
ASDDSATTVFAAAPDPAFAAEPTESTVHTGHTDPASGSAADAPASPWDQGTVSRGPVPESSEWMTDGDAAVDADQATAVIDPAAETTTFVAGQPGAAGTAGAGAAATQMDGATPEDGVTDEAQAEAAAAADVAEDPRRGTLDFGLLILRLVVGGLLIIRGLQTLFAFGGDPGLSALEQSLAAYSFADILAIVIPVAQVVAGGLLVFGLLTPLGAAIAVVVSGFLTGHALSTFDASYWPYALSPTAQLWALTGVVALVITFTGPGRYSADTSRRWATRPLASAWVFALIGLGGAAGLWLAVGGGNPF